MTYRAQFWLWKKTGKKLAKPACCAPKIVLKEHGDMGRNRIHKARALAGLPLYPNVVDGRTYYRFLDPATKKWHSLGSDFEAARKAAARLMATRRADSIDALVARVDRPQRALVDHADWFMQLMAGRRNKRGQTLAAATLYEKRRMLVVLAEKIGPHRDIGTITRRDVAAFLSEFPARASNIYRVLLQQFFASAIAEGYLEVNPAEGTLKRDEVVERQRLALPEYAMILAAAPPWFQRSMELARWSLQRRSDLVAMRVNDWAAGKLSVRQIKVATHGTGMMRITPGPDLRRAIEACISSEERKACPFLIHRKPERVRQAVGREHPFQVSQDMLTREFERVRDLVNAFPSLEASQKPSFHEIRALGADLYRQSGWPDSRVQALLGHSRPEMTAVYLDRHGERWTEVDAT